MAKIKIKITAQQMNAALHCYRELTDPKQILEYLDGFVTRGTENDYENDLARLMASGAKCYYNNWELAAAIMTNTKKDAEEYKGYTIVCRKATSHCALILMGIGLTEQQLNQTNDRLVKCIAGSIINTKDGVVHTAIDRAKLYIDINLKDLS